MRLLARVSRVGSPSNPGATVSVHVRADLVSSIHSVLVELGQQVVLGDEVVILESMKMEIPVLAEVAGTITEISVVVGDVVREGDVLVVITP
jgi:acetyl-CoA carboxylase biotin carboxyl carrier protein